MMISKSLMAASSAPMVLSILSRGESYGYAIIQEVGRMSHGKLEWTEGMLYPVLHRLEKSGWVVSSWRRSESGRRRRYYQLTAKGKDALREERRQWELLSQAFQRLWEEKPCTI